MAAESKYDVVIVGCGPAGAMAAKAAAATGARTLVLERRKRVGAAPHCAEFAPKALGFELEIPPSARAQSVEGMETNLDKKTVFSAMPGWILDRQVFDYHLAEQAAASGAEIWTGCSFKAVIGDKLKVKTLSGSRKIGYGALVAADGAGSALAKSFGFKPLSMLAGVQLTVPLLKPLKRTIIYLGKAYQGGYAWLFPKGGSANLGLGCIAEARPWALLAELRNYLERKGIVGPGYLARGGGAIPVQGPRPELGKGSLLLAGDAAGLTHPLTGAGIPQAVFSGHQAGKAAAKIAQGRPEAQDEYQHQVNTLYRGYLTRGLAARQRWDAEWLTQDFARLMRETWPAFKVK